MNNMEIIETCIYIYIYVYYLAHDGQKEKHNHSDRVHGTWSNWDLDWCFLWWSWLSVITGCFYGIYGIVYSINGVIITGNWGCFYGIIYSSNFQYMWKMTITVTMWYFSENANGKASDGSAKDDQQLGCQRENAEQTWQKAG